MSKNQVFSNFLWRFAERCGAQGVSFLVSIILARLLDPNVYGTIALVTVFTTILNVFIDSGLGTALIQKKDADELDFSSVFYFNIFMCIVLYIIIFFCAPIIANFYEDYSLVPVIRVLSITILISGVKSIQQAYVSRTMQFKRFFFSTLAGTIGSAIIGIIFAYLGFGIWALVIQQIFNGIVDTTILWFTVKWRPKRIFSFKRLKILFSFGWKMLVSSLLDTSYNDLRQLIIGKLYSSSDLAYYNRGKQFPSLVVGNINNSIDSVLLPKLSLEQDSKERVCAMTRRAIKTSIYIMAPFMMLLVFSAKPIVSFILSDKWLPCVSYMRIMCITYMFYPIHTSNLNAIKAMGRSDLFLKLEILKKIVGITLLLITMNLGVMAMAYSLLINSLLCQIINAWPNRYLLNYSYTSQIKDILPTIILSVLSGVAILPISFLNIDVFFMVILQVIIALIIYIFGSIILKIDSYKYIVSIFKEYLNK